MNEFDELLDESSEEGGAGSASGIRAVEDAEDESAGTPTGDGTVLGPRSLDVPSSEDSGAAKTRRPAAEAAPERSGDDVRASSALGTASEGGSDVSPESSGASEDTQSVVDGPRLPAPEESEEAVGQPAVSNSARSARTQRELERASSDAYPYFKPDFGSKLGKKKEKKK
jgi:hypothetical protein